MHFDLADGVAFDVSTRRDVSGGQNGGLHLAIAMTVRNGVRVRWMAPELKIDDDRSGQQVFHPTWQVSGAYRLSSSSRLNWQQISPVPSLFASGQPIPKGFSGTVSASFAWHRLRPETLDVTLPGFVAQGVKTEALVFRLLGVPEEVKGFGSVRKAINYRTEGMAETYRRELQSCRQETGERAFIYCQDRTRAKNDTFELKHGQLAVSGRWWVYDLDQPDPLRGSVNFTLAEPFDIAWQDDAIRVRVVGGDVAGREERIPFASFTARTRFEAPLNATILGGNAPEPYWATQASFEINLGTAGLGRYVIGLPAIEVDGRVVEPKPITLERRSFDVGILPFNC
jgi:hypothetical protein